MLKWFKPKAGLQVVCPHTFTAVPAEGKAVRAGDEFYVRRELDGDGELGPLPASEGPSSLELDEQHAS